MSSHHEEWYVPAVNLGGRTIQKAFLFLPLRTLSMACVTEPRHAVQSRQITLKIVVCNNVPSFFPSFLCFLQSSYFLNLLPSFVCFLHLLPSTAFLPSSSSSSISLLFSSSICPSHCVYFNASYSITLLLILSSSLTTNECF